MLLFEAFFNKFGLWKYHYYLILHDSIYLHIDARLGCTCKKRPSTLSSINLSLVPKSCISTQSRVPPSMFVRACATIVHQNIGTFLQAVSLSDARHRCLASLPRASEIGACCNQLGCRRRVYQLQLIAGVAGGLPFATNCNQLQLWVSQAGYDELEHNQGLTSLVLQAVIYPVTCTWTYRAALEKIGQASP